MILPGKIDKKIIEDVRRLAEPEWDSSLREVVAYRKAVLTTQAMLCAYCRRPVYRDEVGFRELDHVLPKSRSPSDPMKYDVQKASSNVMRHRRHTRGYPMFRYIPENLVVSCKRCNSHKNTFDALADRTHVPDGYPATSDEFEWVHPYFDEYEQHVQFVAGHLYAPVNQSPKGKAVIHACGLDKVEELRARVLDSFAFSYEELTMAMVGAVTSREPFDPLEMATALHRRFGVGSVEAMHDCLRDLIAAAGQGSEEFGSAVTAINKRLGVTGAIKPPVAQPIDVLTDRNAEAEA